jgi:DnaK suppressor protein
MNIAPSIKLGKIREFLGLRRKEILDLIVNGADTRTDIVLDQQRVGRLTRMDAIQQRAMEDETARRRDVELTRIDAALHRISSGDFGYCTACDEPIALKRLENDPANPLCIGCASRAS